MGSTKPYSASIADANTAPDYCLGPVSTALANGESVDGRRLRSEKSRYKIVEATLALVRGGCATPSAEAVAERADVGLRSVFRHFRDMDGLFEQLTEIAMSELRKDLDAPLNHPDWTDRLQELLERRCLVFENTLALLNAIALHRCRDMDDQYCRTIREYLRSNLVEALTPEICRDSTFVAALDLALSAQSWHSLRLVRKLTFDQSQAAIKTTMNALIAQRD